MVDHDVLALSILVARSGPINHSGSVLSRMAGIEEYGDCDIPGMSLQRKRNHF
jgi:hypothetical protein